MKCLRCSQDILDAFFIERSRSEEFKGGRFACPHCGADHVRRQVGNLPSGEPLMTFRLWGHLSAMSLKPPPPGGEGVERRSSKRVKPRR